MPEQKKKIIFVSVLVIIILVGITLYFVLTRDDEPVEVIPEKTPEEVFIETGKKELEELFKDIPALTEEEIEQGKNELDRLFNR